MMRDGMRWLLSLEKANFAEYNTRLTTGETVDLSKRAGKALSDSDAAAINVKVILGSWTLYHIKMRTA